MSKEDMNIRVEIDTRLKTGWIVSITYEFLSTINGKWIKSDSGGVNIYSIGYRLNSMKLNENIIRNIVIKVPYGKKRKIESYLIKNNFNIES